MKYEILSNAILHLKNESYKKWLYIHLTALFAVLAQLARPPGILLFLGLVIYIFWSLFIKNKENWRTGFKKLLSYHPLLLVPCFLLLIFYWYQISLNDFWAYFHSGDNIHLTFPPFQVFNKNQFWVGEIWLEDIIYIFILGFLGALFLWKQKLYPLSFFIFTYLLASTLIAHRDIARYTLPIFPFLLISFEKVLTTKEFKIVMLIVACAIYLYAQNFIIENVAPIPNLSAFN